jgi:hypothetical protein
MQLMMMLMLQWGWEAAASTADNAKGTSWTLQQHAPTAKVSVDLQSIFRLIKAYLHFPFTDNSV